MSLHRSHVILSKLDNNLRIILDLKYFLHEAMKTCFKQLFKITILLINVLLIEYDITDI